MSDCPPVVNLILKILLNTRKALNPLNFRGIQCFLGLIT